jgi:hypothetical protein
MVFQTSLCADCYENDYTSFRTSFNAMHLFLSWARYIQSITPNHVSRRTVLISSSHLRLRVPNYLFPSGCHTKTLQAIRFVSIRDTWPANCMHLDSIILIISGQQYKLRSSSLCSFLLPPVMSCSFNLNIPLRTPWEPGRTQRTQGKLREWKSNRVCTRVCAHDIAPCSQSAVRPVSHLKVNSWEGGKWER